MKQRAIVIASHGDIADISVRRESICSACHKDGGCSTCEGSTEARAVNKIGAKSGDVVEVEMKTGKLLLWAALVFLCPMVAAITALLAGVYFLSSAWQAYILSGAVFVFVFALVWFFVERPAAKNNENVITEIVFRQDYNQ